MTGSLPLKIFNPQGDYVASCKMFEDAAALAGNYGHGAEVRYGQQKSNTIWREGYEEFSAAESYDSAGELMQERINKLFNR